MNLDHPTPGIVIVGAGQAGVQAAEALRAGGCSLPIMLLGDEPLGPYHRPPLSKAWLAGEMEAAQLVLRAPEALERKHIALRTGVRVEAIDRASRQLRLADGTTLAYAGLVLATGARPRSLPLPGADAANVHPLRTHAHAAGLAADLQRCQSEALPVVVIGGGFIGLEVAATARKKGLAVTVLEMAPRLLGRVLAPVLSDAYVDLHRSHGVDVVLGADVSGLEVQDGRVVAVHGRAGQVWPAGLLVVGIGVQANDELARAAGLPCDRGIVVDACARTDDPLIVAAGDCTARRLDDGTLLRLESVHNATEQARCAASALLGQPRPFTGTPWFWSDQYDRKLQMAGLSAGADAWAQRGTPGAAGFSVWHFRAGRLIAVDTVNSPRDHLLARKLLDGARLPTPEQVADPGFDLQTLLVA